MKEASETLAQSLARFREHFGDETICAEHLSKMRWPHGFVCRCGDHRAWFLRSRAMYECLGCRRQTSIKAGTAMQGSRLPLTVWFCAAYLMARDVDLVPVRQLQKLLGVSYKAAWGIRRTLLSLTDVEQEVEDVEQPERSDGFEPLEGLVEVNRTEIPARPYNPISRLGIRNIVVAVALELAPVEDGTGFVQGRIRLLTLQDSSAESIAAFVQANVKPGATLFTDGHKFYRDLSGYNLDPRWHGKRLRHTERVFASMNTWFKADALDRDAVDRGLEYVRADFAPENPRFDRRVTFETLLRRALRAQPDSKALSSRKLR